MQIYGARYWFYSALKKPEPHPLSGHFFEVLWNQGLVLETVGN